MSIRTLKEFITECLRESIVRRDKEDGRPVIRKIVTFKKRGTRFTSDDHVDTEVDPKGNLEVDGLEKWFPEESNKLSPMAIEEQH